MAGSHVERRSGRNRPDDVPLEVAHLHDHAAAADGLEMQLASLRPQRVGHLRSVVHLLEHVLGGRRRKRVDGHRGDGLGGRRGLDGARALRLTRSLYSTKWRKVEVHRSSWITVAIHPWIYKRRHVSAA